MRYACRQCDREFEVAQGLKVHTAKMHPPGVKLAPPVVGPMPVAKAIELPAAEFLEIAQFLEGLSPTKLVRIFAAILREME